MEAIATKQPSAGKAGPKISGYAELTHLPGVPKISSRLIETALVLRKPVPRLRAMVERYGRVYRSRNFAGWSVAMAGPEANELVLFDEGNLFSSEQGWKPILGGLFPNGLMMMDGLQHRSHRRILSSAFKAEVLKDQLIEVNKQLSSQIGTWPVEVIAYPLIKRLTLTLASSTFFGLSWEAQSRDINEALVDMVQASTAVIRNHLPFSRMARGIRGRQFMCNVFASEISKRRNSEGSDLFTQLCIARDEGGNLLTDQQVIDHLNFFVIAAHDTLTSSLVSVIYYLARYPEWQDKLREEVLNFRRGPDQR